MQQQATFVLDLLILTEQLLSTAQGKGDQDPVKILAKIVSKTTSVLLVTKHHEPFVTECFTHLQISTEEE
jgi:hypothetical protein